MSSFKAPTFPEKHCGEDGDCRPSETVISEPSPTSHGDISFIFYILVQEDPPFKVVTISVNLC